MQAPSQSVPVSRSYAPEEPGELRRPTEFTNSYQVFSSHYLYHRSRHIALGEHPRPTLGELSTSLKMSKATCKRHRKRFERDLAALEKPSGDNGAKPPFNIGGVKLTPPKQ